MEKERVACPSKLVRRYCEKFGHNPFERGAPASSRMSGLMQYFQERADLCEFERIVKLLYRDLLKFADVHQDLAADHGVQSVERETGSFEGGEKNALSLSRYR